MKVAIIGVGTTAMIVADIIARSHNFTLAGFVGTSEEQERLKRSKVYHGSPFLGDHSILKDLRKDNIGGFVAAIGDNKIRAVAQAEALVSLSDPLALEGLTPLERSQIVNFAIPNQAASRGNIEGTIFAADGYEIGDTVRVVIERAHGATLYARAATPHAAPVRRAVG